MNELDLSVPENLLLFLADGPFASSEATRLVGPGGGANYIFRITLQQPYNGKSSAVVKHGKPYIPGDRRPPFALEREVRLAAIACCYRHWLI